MRQWRTCLFSLLLLGRPVQCLAKDDILAVLSSELAPYQEAFAGFQEVVSHPVQVVRLGDKPFHFQGQPDLIVTFGGKAAHQRYPEGSTLIYSMAPGTLVSPAEHSGLSVQVSMMPKPSVMLGKLKEIQPSLKRLTVLWTSPSFALYARELLREAPKQAVQIQAEKLDKPEGLPARLRELKDQTDAIWLPPDPLLINSANIVIIAQFSWSNHTPLYSAVPGLTEQGAVASLSSSYREIGHAVGRAVLREINGDSLPEEIYPEVTEVTVNAESAVKAGLELPKNLPGGAPQVQP